MLWMLGGMMLAGLAACSGDDDTATDGSAPQTADDGVKVRHITITETEEEAARQIMTRASLAEGDGILTALWTADDGLTYCNLSRVDRGNSDAPYSGLLIANSTAATSQFTGDVYCLFRTVEVSPMPSAREMTLEPPMPKRLETAERNMKAGMQTVAAVSLASLPVMPMKKVSAML